MNRTARERQKGIKGFLYWWLESEYNPKQIFVEIFILSVILFSVFLTFWELYHQENDSPLWILQIDNTITVFFILEYIIRLYISTDFINDIKQASFFSAIINKCIWIFSPSALLDLAALLPIIRFLRIFRAFRLFKFIKILRFLRILKLKNFFLIFQS